jgi:hypothetical protein
MGMLGRFIKFSGLAQRAAIFPGERTVVKGQGGCWGETPFLSTTALSIDSSRFSEIKKSQPLGMTKVKMAIPGREDADASNHFP